MKRLPLFLLIFILSWSALSLAQEPPLRQIVDLRVVVEGDSQKVILSFDQQYTETASYQFESGFFQAILPRTDFKPQLALLRVNNQFIRDLRLHREGKNTIFEIQFADSTFRSEGLVNDQIDKSELIFQINKKGSPLFQDKGELGAATVEGDMVFAPGAFTNPQYKTDDSVTSNIVQMLLALFLMLLLFYLALLSYNRFFVTRFRFKKGKHQIRVSSSYHITPKQKVMILEVNDRAYACGVTPNNISVISEVSANSSTKIPTRVDATKKEEVDFSALRGQYLEKKQKKEAKPALGKKGFSSELMDRVKKLKPID